jgi:hypothetical protein
MGIKSGPRIVKDGLVIDLDPAALRSYSGSGNTWYDLTSNSYNQTLTGMGYTTDNNGLMNSSGSSYATGAINSVVNIDGPLSMSFWIKFTNLTGIQSLGITNGTTSPSAAMQIGLRTGGLGTIWKYGGATLIPFTNPTVNTWYHYSVTLASSTMYFYINGAYNNSAVVTPQSGGAVSLNFGDYKSDGTGNEKILGYLGSYQLYNRALTAQEILQNYNATKRRYGL